MAAIGDQAHRGAPTIRYFDLFLLIDNEKGAVTEFPARRRTRLTGAPPERDGPFSAMTHMLWAVFTLIAAAAQTARNAMQRELTATLGTVGATHVRFLFGFPFALVFLAGVMTVTGDSLPRPPPMFWPWVLAGALTQIAATATMLSVMGERSFVVAYAYIKTEPVQVALFGLIFLGDKSRRCTAVAILIATAGVIVISLKPGAGRPAPRARPLIGLLSGALFALSAIGYRGAILSLHLPDFVLAATFTRDGRAGACRRRCCRSIWRCATRACCAPSRAPGGRRCSPASWAPSPREFWFLGLRHRHGGERAHAGAGRGAVRARRDALHLQAADHARASASASCWW